MGNVLQALANTFAGIGTGRDVEQALIGFCVLNNRCGLSIYSQNYKALGFLSCFMKSPEARRNVVND